MKKASVKILKNFDEAIIVDAASLDRSSLGGAEAKKGTNCLYNLIFTDSEEFGKSVVLINNS